MVQDNKAYRLKFVILILIIGSLLIFKISLEISRKPALLKTNENQISYKWYMDEVIRRKLTYHGSVDKYFNYTFENRYGNHDAITQKRSGRLGNWYPVRL